MLDIGKELRDLRLLKGISLKEISEITKINLKYLEFLEENNFHFLPEVYVRAFLKNYVRALDGDEKKFLNAFDEILHPYEIKASEISENKIISDTKTEKIEASAEEISKTIKRFFIGKSNIITLRNVSFLIGALVVIILILILIMTQENKREKNNAQVASEKMYEEVQEKSNIFDNIASDDSLILGIKAKDSVWIQIKMDNSVTQEVYLRNGQSQKFKARDNFQLLIGNAGAIALYLNETELPFTGVKGSVKRIKVDKNGIQLIQAKNESQNQ